MSTERSLILFKPDCVTKSNVGDVLARYEAAGFTIRGIKMMSLSDEILREHYSHVADEPFFPNIANFMQSAPVIAMVLEGDDVVAKVRTMLGPTNPQNAEAGTIRGDFGESMMINVCHASDSPENGEIEVNRFFSESETFSY
ncbi:MAG: nucleoside-diphosphate kinase [Verrucomicrobiales bacterium]|jgi:nucleoside-diphosphate kinase|nr:nucleoside-diphosphate kinase [Verrucomicrobiales bacterium]|tara:strand:+ start:36899 stop:37324 length:426 start_codon:yes stop_codon:yes gene_type:complete